MSFNVENYNCWINYHLPENVIYPLRIVICGDLFSTSVIIFRKGKLEYFLFFSFLFFYVAKVVVNSLQFHQLIEMGLYCT